jgi:hypothetical protein
MANIEAYRKDVPLYEVAEHIVGDLGDLPVDFMKNFIKNHPENQADPEHYGPVVDRLTVEAWDRALGELISAVRDGKVRLRGFRAGSEISEEMPPIEFAEEAHNPFADFDLGIDHSGKLILEFEDRGAKIRRAPTVLWTDLCADSGAEVLKLWPKPIKPTAKARGRSACEEWLVSERLAGPQTQSKEEYKAEGIKRFGVGPAQFRTAWDEAAKIASSKGWGRPGRPRKSSDQKSSGQ